MHSEASEFEHLGWRFQAFRGSIASAEQLSRLSKSLELGHVPLPEETYSSSFIEVSVGDRLSIRVDAAGALRNWHQLQRQTHPAPSVLAFDWTYTSTYGGDLRLDDRTMSLPMDLRTAGGEMPVVWAPFPAGLPIERLMRREPILFYSEIVLYADDLHDRGV
jgi:hypothetical protein